MKRPVVAILLLLILGTSLQTRDISSFDSSPDLGPAAPTLGHEYGSELPALAGVPAVGLFNPGSLQTRAPRSFRLSLRLKPVLSTPVAGLDTRGHFARSRGPAVARSGYLAALRAHGSFVAWTTTTPPPRTG